MEFLCLYEGCRKPETALAHHHQNCQCTLSSIHCHRFIPVEISQLIPSDTKFYILFYKYRVADYYATEKWEYYQKAIDIHPIEWLIEEKSNNFMVEYRIRFYEEITKEQFEKWRKLVL